MAWERPTKERRGETYVVLLKYLAQGLVSTQLGETPPGALRQATAAERDDVDARVMAYGSADIRDHARHRLDDLYVNNLEPAIDADGHKRRWTDDEAGK